MKIKITGATPVDLGNGTNKEPWYKKHSSKIFEAEKGGSFRSKPAFRVDRKQLPEFKDIPGGFLLVRESDAEVIPEAPERK